MGPPRGIKRRLQIIDAQPTSDSIVVRLAGDSGDGVQLMGTQFAASTAAAGSDFATFPDYPAEIRAPAGTTFGVSAYQINLGTGPITTAGDAPQVLVAFNPAALKVSLSLVASGALILLNTDGFTARNLTKAGYAEDPRETGDLHGYQVVPIELTRLTLEAVKDFGLSKSEGGRCKNFYALGVLLWMFGRDLETIERWLNQRFSKDDTVREANLTALRAGHAYAETAELAAAVPKFSVAPADFPPGDYRGIRGSDALALGLAAAGELADRTVMFCSYPITPASPLLHRLARLGELGVGVFQAEDEIAAVCAAIGASYAGAIGVTSSSGPGIALKTEAIGLAINAELPLVIVNSQRGGPSTGLPTKTEQSDLYQAVYGRNADAPVPVLAASSPSDCFDTAIEAVRIAVRHMTPVILLSDGYLANAAEPWKIPDMAGYAPIEANPVPSTTSGDDGDSVAFRRDPESLGRPWISPGTPGLMYRVGGLEKDIRTGQISYDAENHQKMSEMRAAKVQSVADFIPDQAIEIGPQRGKLAVVGWGSTYGALYQAVHTMADRDVSHIHIRYLSPLPKNLGELLAGFDRVLVPEMNMGQLATLLRDKLGIDPVPLGKVTGQPFHIDELCEAIERELDALGSRVRDAV
ncbi:MAG: 2-oxoacid:acceptor oxidoreductase subunit alpha [Gammaproteobacteria bacterium]|nr:2-oxoacid:acceptor oxidoreductase subunit alpha [Gammaproteobacteria bacterium]MDH3506599.1 2-oxoacid:acceptor oxidoreductase subunit alpha [Gammaproteobacteria bacterium]